MKKLVFLLASVLLISTVVISCSSDNDKQTEQQFEASFEGEFTNYGTLSRMMGYVTIDNNNVVTLDVIAGKLIGTASKNGENYNLSITQTLGIFENILNISGEINTSSKRLSVTGTNLDGSSVSIVGNVMTTGGWENLAKSRVIFVHNEEVGVTASVTINNVTHSGLNSRWESFEEGVWEGNCERLLTWTHMLGNFDNIQVTSDISCYTGTLQGNSVSGGEPVPYTDCSSIYYILDKNTDYTYTVAWSTGEIHTGQFTSLDGGGNLPICLTRDEGNNTNGTGQFTLDGVTYNTESFVYTNCHTSDYCGDSVECIMLPTGNGNDNLVFYNVPKAASGTFQINDFDYSDVCELSGVCYVNPKNHFSQSGTLTKTGIRSFTFSSIFYKSSDPSETYTITGSANY